MSKKTHKLRGVLVLPEKGRFGMGAFVGLYRQTIMDACDNKCQPLPDNFNNMHEHEKLHALAKCGVRHVPQYT
jgi:hypothetical protein